MLNSPNRDFQIWILEMFTALTVKADILLSNRAKKAIEQNNPA